MGDQMNVAELIRLRNYLLEELERLSTCVESLKEKKEISMNGLQGVLPEGGDGLWFSFMDSFVGEFKRTGRYKTSLSYKCTSDSLSKYLGSKDLRFGEVNHCLLKAYEDDLKGRGVKLNTISFYMRVLRAVYNRAVNKGLMEQRYPFRNVYTGIEKTSKRAVEECLILQLKCMDLKHVPSLALARDLFLFSFYMRGMAFVDIAYLKKSDLKNNVLIYKRQKTGQLLRVKVIPCIERIIVCYREFTKDIPFLLPIFRSTNARPLEIQYRNALSFHNKQLKKLSRLLGADVNLTSYVARHSWATIAKYKNIPLAVISEGMGHDSVDTTKIYLASLDTSVLDDANCLILKDFE